MNEDDSTFEIPDYIMSRIQPAIELPFPKAEEELRILRYNLPTAPEELLKICVGYLQQAHGLDLPYSIRDGLNAVRFSQKMGELRPGPWDGLFRQAIRQILGEEALDMESLAERRRQEGLRMPNMQLGDFFFDEDNPLNPDKD
jgi:MoxR-like ATPase